MNINTISNVSFSGLWQQSIPRKIDSFVKNHAVNNVYLQERVYRPFKDEIVKSDKIQEGVKAYSYVEYDSYDDNYGNEELSTSIQVTRLGSRLDITEGEYLQLSVQKEIGEKAARKLENLGEKNVPPMFLPLSRSHDTRNHIQEIDAKNAQELISRYAIK